MSVQLGPSFDLGKSAEAAIEHTEAVNEAVKLTNQYVQQLAEKNAELVGNLVSAGTTADQRELPTPKKPDKPTPLPDRGVDPGTALIIQTVSQALGLIVNVIWFKAFGAAMDAATATEMAVAIQALATIGATAYNNLSKKG